MYVFTDPEQVLRVLHDKADQAGIWVRRYDEALQKAKGKRGPLRLPYMTINKSDAIAMRNREQGKASAYVHAAEMVEGLIKGMQ